MLTVYNTQSRSKEPFRPVDPVGRKVGMYYCGPTVYDSLHLGHGRAAIVPDTMRRYLEYRGYEVRYVTNFTDVDDNIIKRAIRENRDWREVTWVYMEEYGRVTSALGNRPADVHPRATDHIEEMVALGMRLIESGNAYAAADGDVYFDVSSFEGYGALSGRDLDQQRTDAAGRLGEEQLAVKRNPGDFILWKLNKNDPQEFLDHPEQVPGWESPWGVGRPGWHLECSALSEHYLGMPFDIHGGGADLLFPHHENERAQNCCGWAETLAGEPPVRYWLHNGFITVKAKSQEELDSEYAEGETVKMSKSLGNVKWIREMVWPEGPYDPLAVRMLLLASHYRSPIQFSGELLDQSTARLDRLYATVDELREVACAEGIFAAPATEGEAFDVAQRAIEGFEHGMDDDFNTPEALAAVAELSSWANKNLLEGGRALVDESAVPAQSLVVGTLVRLLHTLGFPAERSAGGPAAGGESESELLQLLGEVRREARSFKQFALSDRIRDRLDELGFELRDLAGGDFEIRRR